MTVLVDVEEVRALVRGPDHGGLTGMEIKDKLSTTAKVAAALIKHGHMATITSSIRSTGARPSSCPRRRLSGSIANSCRCFPSPGSGTAFHGGQEGAPARRRRARVQSQENRGDVLSEG